MPQSTYDVYYICRDKAFNVQEGVMQMQATCMGHARENVFFLLRAEGCGGIEIKAVVLALPRQMKVA